MGTDAGTGWEQEASLPEECYDLIYAASAFHWVDAEIGCPKALRLLKSGGVFALLRYNIIPAEGEALYEAIQAVYDKHYYSYYTSKKRLKRKAREEFRKPVEILRGYGFEDMEKYGFSDVTMKLYDVERIFDVDEFITFCNTLADHRNLPEHNRAALYAGIREAIVQHGGWHKEDNVFQLYMGRKV